MKTQPAPLRYALHSRSSRFGLKFRQNAADDIFKGMDCGLVIGLCSFRTGPQEPHFPSPGALSLSSFTTAWITFDASLNENGITEWPGRCHSPLNRSPS